MFEERYKVAYIKFYKKFFAKMKVINFGNSIIFEIPYLKKRKIRMNKIFKNRRIDKIVLPKGIVGWDDERILVGTTILRDNLEVVLNYIYNLKNKKSYEQQIYILCNQYKKENIKNIEKLAMQMKNVNLVTKNIYSFGRLEAFLYSNFGVMLNISNNKRKSLTEADLIINFDFTNSEILEFYMNRKAIIINLPNEKLNLGSSFCGILVNDVEIDLPNEIFQKFKDNGIFEGFDKKVLFESLLFSRNFNFSSESIQIEGLVGNRGIINKMEMI